MRAWQLYPNARPDDWCVFGPQMLRWMRFREWQARRRTLHKSYISEYTQWAKRFLLNRHSYTAPVDFKFEEDPKQQDQLTTFIEYLTYEYNFYTERYAWYERRGKWYDKQWKKLVDSGVLRPYETEEFILNGKSSFQRTSERIQAEKAMKSARSAVSLAQRTHCGSSQPPLIIQQRLEATQSKLQSAVQLFESTKKHNSLITKFISDTHLYRDAKCNAERHTILLEWIREQVSLIELELKQSKTAESNSDNRNGGKRDLERDQDEKEDRKPKRQKWSAPDENSRNDPIDNEPLSKRQKDSRQLHLSHLQTPNIVETAMIEPQRESIRDEHRSWTSTQPLYRSARIISRQEAGQTVMTRSSAAKSAPRRSRRRMAQAPTPLLSTEPQDQQSGFPATTLLTQKKFRQQSFSQRSGVQPQDIPKIPQQVRLIEAGLNGSNMAETGPNAVSSTKRRFGCDGNDKATYDQIKRQRRNASEPSLMPGHQEDPGYQGAKPKRSRDNATDNRPPSKRFKRDDDNLGSYSETSNNADAGPAGDLQELGTNKVRRPDGNKRTVRTIQKPNSKGHEPSSSHLQRKKRLYSPRSKSTGKIQKPLLRLDRRAPKTTTAQGSRGTGAVPQTGVFQRLTRRCGQGGQFFYELDSHGKARLVVA